MIRKCKLKNYDKREGKQLEELELLADLRHHGSANCLIDFTRSALSALWFACEQTKYTDQSAATTEQEAEIDRLVYGLYGLTAEEIDIVEGKR